MSDHTLPDDLREWPDDPFLLLGVARDVDAKEAKRAYVRLVRKFKPEHEPDKFQRIRGAYEHIEKLIVLRERFGVDLGGDYETDGEQEGEFDDDREGANLLDAAEIILREIDTAHERPQGRRSLPLSPDAEEACAAAWQDVRARRYPDGYAKLLALRERHPGNESVLARLYWLLVVAPQCDTSRVACDFLLEGLLANKLQGPLRTLYFREVYRAPSEALSARAKRLVQAEIDGGPMIDWLECRWHAAGKLGKWSAITEDLMQVRPRFVPDDEYGWGRLLMLAIDQLAWMPAPQAVQAVQLCRQELDTLSHVHRQLSDELDRLDLLIDVAAGWIKLLHDPQVPREWLPLIPLSWTRDFHECLPHLVPILQLAANDPWKTLQHFDRIVHHSPAAASQLGSAIERARYELHAEHDQDPREGHDMCELSKQFFLAMRSDLHNYTLIRRELLRYCCLEAVEPLLLAAAADEIGVPCPSHSSWQDILREDGSISYVYRAYRAMYG